MDSQSTYLFGRRFRNRLFVGGLPLNITAQELAQYFANFTYVIEAKIITDENGISKGYGFVTFSSEEDVRKVTEMGTLFFKNKKLNLGPAVKKQMTPVERQELVVVNTTNMRGEYYYPILTHTVQYPPYQYATHVPLGTGVVYDVPPAPLHYGMQYVEEKPLAPPPQPQFQLHVQNPPRTKKQVPPRFRRPREH